MFSYETQNLLKLSNNQFYTKSSGYTGNLTFKYTDTNLGNGLNQQTQFHCQKRKQVP